MNFKQFQKNKIGYTSTNQKKKSTLTFKLLSKDKWFNNNNNYICSALDQKSWNSEYKNPIF